MRPQTGRRPCRSTRENIAIPAPPSCDGWATMTPRASVRVMVEWNIACAAAHEFGQSAANTRRSFDRPSSDHATRERGLPRQHAMRAERTPIVSEAHSPKVDRADKGVDLTQPSILRSFVDRQRLADWHLPEKRLTDG